MEILPLPWIAEARPSLTKSHLSLFFSSFSYKIVPPLKTFLNTLPALWTFSHHTRRWNRNTDLWGSTFQASVWLPGDECVLELMSLLMPFAFYEPLVMLMHGLGRICSRDRRRPSALAPGTELPKAPCHLWDTLPLVT